MSDLTGRRALITGASRGIGAAIARRLASLGADVVLAARTAPAIEDLAVELRGQGVRAVAVPADMGDRDSLASLVATAGRELGGLDILVNNAGILPAATRAERTSWADWDQAMGVNLSAPWFLACRSRELMPERGGVVVNVASTASFYPSRGLVAYNVSKAALLMLTKVLALEWAREGVRVVAVAPGKIDTDLVAPIMEWTARRGLEVNPQQRLGRSEEVADLVAFLVSDAAGYLTGVTVPIDGGELLATGG